MKTFKQYLKEASIDTVYHITRLSSLPKIKQEGILPNIPTDYHDKNAVYVFPSVDDYEMAMFNWLGDRYDENEKLVVLTLSTNGLKLNKSVVPYELLSFERIPPENIKDVTSI